MVAVSAENGWFGRGYFARVAWFEERLGRNGRGWGWFRDCGWLAGVVGTGCLGDLVDDGLRCEVLIVASGYLNVVTLSKLMTEKKE